MLPPTITLQYHFLTDGPIIPYVGAGLNMTFFYSPHPAGGVVTSTKYTDGVGPALEVGADFKLGGNWYANVDVKQIFLRTDATLGTIVGTVRAKTMLDPLVAGVGIGYKF